MPQPVAAPATTAASTPNLNALLRATLLNLDAVISEAVTALPREQQATLLTLLALNLQDMLLAALAQRIPQLGQLPEAHRLHAMSILALQMMEQTPCTVPTPQETVAIEHAVAELTARIAQHLQTASLH